MKTIWILMMTGGWMSCLAGAEGPEKRDDLVVHEWGTFTAVTGSDGAEVAWWTSLLEGPAALPEFVHPAPVLTKGQNWLLRMETPVIYFYARQPAKLTVRVDDSKVRITDMYPLAKAGMMMPNGGAEWQVEIRPPDAAVASLLPAVGGRGAHYRHARDVPDAWWVVRQGEPPKSEVEKFIFYRGAGSLRMPKRIVQVRNQRVEMVRGGLAAFLVQAGESGLKWRRVAGSGRDEGGNLAVPFPCVDPLAEAGEAGLVSELIKELTAAGLTGIEAVAMVRTWQEAWMGEPGLRVLEILPRAWVDEVLPLTVIPSPGRMERVFVGRWELLSDETEQRVIDLVDGGTTAGGDPVVGLGKLSLGRFMSAAIERAALVRDWRFRREALTLASRLNLPAVAGKEE